MAIYHHFVQIFSRGKGHSAVAKAAYRSGSRLHDERRGKSFDYTKKSDVVHSEILAPTEAPEWVQDREKLWNAVEKHETRKDSQLAREFEISMPRELTKEQQIDLAREYGRQFSDAGFVADLNLHHEVASDGEPQPNLHIMVTLRRVDKNGFRDEEKPRDFNNKDQFLHWRKKWADDANHALEKAGHDERIDHRTLVVQREEALRNGDFEKAAKLDRIPQTKGGTSSTGIRKDGRKSKRADFQQQIKQDVLERQELARNVINIKSDVQAGKLSRADAGDKLEKLSVDASKKSDFWKSKGSRIGERHWSSLSSQLKIDAQSTRMGNGLGQAAEKIGGGKAGSGAALRPGKLKMPGTGGGGRGGGDEVDKLMSQTSASIKKVAQIMAKAASSGLPTPGGAAAAAAKSIIKPGLGRRL